MIGIPDEGGHYFTIWGARQTGKTWLMRQAMQEIPKRYGDRFAVHTFSLGNLRGFEYSQTQINQGVGDIKVPAVLGSILESNLPGNPHVPLWKDVTALFSRHGGLWDRPVLLLLDEEETALAKLSTTETVNGVEVSTVAIGWV